MSIRAFVFVFIALLTLPGMSAQEDGVYQWSPHDGPAVKLKIIDGSICSLTNSNDAFSLRVTFDSDGRPSGTAYYMTLGGAEKRVSSSGTDGGSSSITIDRMTKEEALSVSKILGIPVQNREHPGHRIDAVFTTDKPAYAPGEAITVVMTLKNLGDEPIYFERMSCGPKDPSFSFSPVSIPFGNAEVTKLYTIICPSIIDTLPAHAEIRMSAKLDECVETKVPGRYHFLGSYILQIFKSNHADSFSPMWLDYVTRGFHFDVQRPK